MPSWIFTGACDMRKACKSVLATINSMPSTPASIMRLTALPPPPPIPITLILASLRASSLKLMRMLESLVIFVHPLIKCKTINHQDFDTGAW